MVVYAEMTWNAEYHTGEIGLCCSGGTNVSYHLDIDMYGAIITKHIKRVDKTYYKKSKVKYKAYYGISIKRLTTATSHIRTVKALYSTPPNSSRCSSVN